MAKIEKRALLEELLKKQEALKVKISSIEAKLKNEENKKITRMKILAGAYTLEQYKGKMDKLGQMLDGFLTRNNDRLLFGLPALKEKTRKTIET